MTDHTALFAASAIALYAAHHVGDYWVQTDHQARHKGAEGWDGQRTCLLHVATYTLTQAVFLCVTGAVTGMAFSFSGYLAALAVSAGTHYLADRREHGIMLRLARALRLEGFLEVGRPRGIKVTTQSIMHDDEDMTVDLDNPTLGTGAWALDQSWHIFFGVFVAALLLTGLS